MKNENQEQELAQLMKEMGSTKGFDPIPPDQYLFFRNDSDPEQRVLAAARATTIRQGYRRPFMADGQGRPLSLNEIAKLVGMDPRNLTNTMKSLCDKGLIRVEKKPYRVMLCGKITHKTAKLVTDVESLTYVRTKSEKSWTRYEIPSYSLRLIQTWPKDRQEVFFRKHKDWWERTRELELEAMTFARIISSQEEDTLFSEFGLQKKRKTQVIPDVEKAKGNKKGTIMRQTPKNRFPRMTASLLSLEGISTEKTILRPSSSKQLESKSNNHPSKPTTKNPDPELLTILEALQKYGPCDLDAAQQLLTSCRKETAGATVRAILEAVNVKSWRMNGRVKNKIGFLLSAVPKMFSAAVLQVQEEQAQELKAQELQSIRARRAQDRMTAQNILANPDLADEETKVWAEGIVKRHAAAAEERLKL